MTYDHATAYDIADWLRTRAARVGMPRIAELLVILSDGIETGAPWAASCDGTPAKRTGALRDVLAECRTQRATYGDYSGDRDVVRLAAELAAESRQPGPSTRGLLVSAAALLIRKIERLDRTTP